jgi:hypothetical protein
MTENASRGRPRAADNLAGARAAPQPDPATTSPAHGGAEDLDSETVGCNIGIQVQSRVTPDRYSHTGRRGFPEMVRIRRRSVQGFALCGLLLHPVAPGAPPALPPAAGQRSIIHIAPPKRHERSARLPGASLALPTPADTRLYTAAESASGDGRDGAAPPAGPAAPPRGRSTPDRNRPYVRPRRTAPRVRPHPVPSEGFRA